VGVKTFISEKGSKEFFLRCKTKSGKIQNYLNVIFRAGEVSLGQNNPRY
jgi:hypothetical protein